MRTFIGWIEKDGEIFFLTDQEVFSKRGMQLFRHCKDDDILGHGAIRLYYGKEGKSLQGGTDHEESRFWEAEKLPKEIQALHPEDPDEFMKHWGRMWGGDVFQTDYFLWILREASDPYKELAAKKLLDQDLANQRLCSILFYAPDIHKERAWERLLQQNPWNYELCSIIFYASGIYKDRAWKQLLQRDPSHNDFRRIINNASYLYRWRARSELKKRGFSDIY